jgi:ribosomal protein L37AE/L43A
MSLDQIVARAVSNLAKNNNKEASMTCNKCGNTLIAADCSEHVIDGFVLNFWSCPKCGHRFETEAYVEPNIDNCVVKELFPSAQSPM